MINKHFWSTVVLCGIFAINCLFAPDTYSAFYLFNSLFQSNSRALSSNTLGGVVIEQTEADTKVIPDKYNTGCRGELTVVEMNDKVGNIQFVAGSNSTVTVLDFAYRNKDAEGTITFENLDFSNHKFAIYNSDKLSKKIKLVFNNCKFSSASVGKKDDNISCRFNNCSFNNFSGSNAVFNYCKFGQSYSDGIVPFKNVHLNSCFFFDMTSVPAYDKELHIDGTQIYGLAELDATNISYDNCRFEIPSINAEGSTAYVNACIMLQMEYSNADGISFTDCVVNGGGYSVYARSKSEKFSLENIRFDGLKIGCSKVYGAFYSKTADGVAFNDISETDSLYIGSVWKENGKTYLSVTNDTNLDRTLTVYTNTGTYQYTIEACPNGSELTSSMLYSDMPFDVKIEINADCDNLVCFDTTISGMAKQIRFVNWKGGNVYLDDLTAQELFTQKVEIITSGKCGADVEYALTNTGVLTLSGSGATYDYHSAKLAPWSEYSDRIKTIRIEQGITDLGNQLFSTCSAVTEISLPDGLEYIGTRTFARCPLITRIVLPASIKEIGTAAFSTVTLTEAVYKGTDISQIEIAGENDRLKALLSYQTPEEESTTSTPAVTTSANQNQPSNEPTDTDESQAQTSAATSKPSSSTSASNPPAETQNENQSQAPESSDNSSASEDFSHTDSGDVKTTHDETDSPSPDTPNEVTPDISDVENESEKLPQTDDYSATQQNENESTSNKPIEMTENNLYLMIAVIIAVLLLYAVGCIILYKIKTRR